MWISRAKLKTIREAADATIKAADAMHDNAFLISIEREGRLNKFTFARGDKLVVIETMGLISDDFGQWRKDLGV